MIRRIFQRWARAFFRRPALSFATQLAILAPLALSDDGGRTAAIYAFAAPWLLPIFGVLNLPFLGAAFRAFRLDPATRRNHALEHATILKLEAKLTRRLAGRAARNGFHVSGPVTTDEIRRAFDAVRRAIEDGKPVTYVTPRCGSSIAVALGLGVTLLWTAVLVSVILRPALPWRAAGLGTAVLAFLALRGPVGRAIQRRWLLSDDFASVSVRDIRTAPRLWHGRGPGYFVETTIRPRHG